MDLTPGQRAALGNLSRKKAGQSVEWISIADARALTDLGLAERDRSGWRITPEGEAALSEGAGARTATLHTVPSRSADTADEEP